VVAVFVSESGSPQVLVPLKMIAAVPGRASALRVVDARGCGAAHDPVRAEAPEEFDGRVPQEVSQTHHVVAGVDHDPDKWVALVPLACRDQSLDQVPHLGGGHGGEVVARSQSPGVQGAVHEERPVSRATIHEQGQPGIIRCLFSPRP
jgi:hypothetical protein